MSPFTYDISPTEEDAVNEEPEHKIRSGPLTPRQFEVLAAVSLGEPYQAIAHRMGKSRQVITNDVGFAAKKMGARSSREAVAKYATYLAYNRAAELLRTSKVPVPIDEAEEHVNHVLEGLAAILSERAAALLPK